MTRQEIVITPDGEMLARQIFERAVRFPEEVLRRHEGEIKVSVAGLISGVDVSPVENAAMVARVYNTIKKDKITWVLELKEIRFRTGVITDESGSLITLSFKGEHPQLDLVWAVPEGVRVFYALNTSRSGSFLISGKNYLFALNASYQALLLPTGNVYEDCWVCTGDFSGQSESHSGVVENCLEQFTKSTWNTDLFSSRENSFNMFRFMPSEKEGFIQLPVIGNWERLCKKVNTSIMDGFIETIKAGESNDL
jgi:hypothetical protein